MNFGIDRLLADPDLRKPLEGRRVALVAHPASVTRDLTHSLDALIAAGVNVTSAFGPQHGLKGDKQDNMVETADETDPMYGIPVFSLYGEVRRPTGQMMSSADVFLFDLQDLGCRIYTFVTTLLYLLEEAANHGKSVWVLDRPNPAGRPVEGTLLVPGQESFVGAAPMPMRHGLTMGEMGRWFVENFGPALIARVAAEAPGVRLRFLPKLDRDSAPLREAAVDLETGVAGETTSPEIRAQVLFRDRFVGVVRNGAPLSHGRVTPARYAKGQHILVSRRGRDRGPVDEALAKGGLEREINLLLITALLTLGGYSLTDTVVVFDRIRENLRTRVRRPLEETINRSINEVLRRTIVTSLTVILVLIVLLFLGGEVIFDFSLALFLGVIVGTYSSIFVASPILLVWRGGKGKLLGET